MPEYPENLLRGLRKSACLDGDRVTSVAFRPDTRKRRKDGNYDISINWEDSDEALVVTFADKNNSQYGAARLPLEALRVIDQMPVCAGNLDYERDELEHNPFHGNIIFDGNLPKKLITSIAHALSLYATLEPRK